MAHTVLFDNGTHKNILLDETPAGSLAIHSNQHVIIDNQSGTILDPGGHKIYARVLAHTMGLLGKAQLETILLSHQDPDIVAACNGWLMTTNAKAYIPSLWTRFIAHFGIDRLVENRILPVPDEGMVIPLGKSELWLIPAHFLHSPGNMQVYDPIAKVLYSGDLGASAHVQTGEVEAKDFTAQLQHMQGFHQRYMASQKAGKAWASCVRQLDIDIIAPQHGPFFRGKEMVQQFIAWVENTPCGVDLLPETYPIPRPRINI